MPWMRSWFGDGETCGDVDVRRTSIRTQTSLGGRKQRRKLDTKLARSPTTTGTLNLEPQNSDACVRFHTYLPFCSFRPTPASAWLSFSPTRLRRQCRQY